MHVHGAGTSQPGGVAPRSDRQRLHGQREARDNPVFQFLTADGATTIRVFALQHSSAASDGGRTEQEVTWAIKTWFNVAAVGWVGREVRLC